MTLLVQTIVSDGIVMASDRQHETSPEGSMGQ